MQLAQRPLEATTNAGRKGVVMSQREMNLLWLKDTLEHLRGCQEQLQWAEDNDAVHLLTETMLRDLDCCRRICERLHRRSAMQHAL
jgi:hypothetical protein